MFKKIFFFFSYILVVFFKTLSSKKIKSYKKIDKLKDLKNEI
jgi:hypothetical protein